MIQPYDNYFVTSWVNSTKLVRVTLMEYVVTRGKLTTKFDLYCNYIFGNDLNTISILRNSMIL